MGAPHPRGTLTVVDALAAFNVLLALLQAYFPSTKVVAMILLGVAVTGEATPGGQDGQHNVTATPIRIIATTFVDGKHA